MLKFYWGKLHIDYEYHNVIMLEMNISENQATHILV